MDTMKPTWLAEPQKGEDIHGRDLSANVFAADYTINQTLHGRSHANARPLSISVPPDHIVLETLVSTPGTSESTVDSFQTPKKLEKKDDPGLLSLLPGPGFPLHDDRFHNERPKWVNRQWDNLATFVKFIGPGFMIAVAYIDPGNYATDIAAGASYHFNLLFIVLLSNVVAVFLQSLAIKLGTITGLDLATATRVFLPRWLNLIIYALAEVAIIATDMAVVIGTATALHLLIPRLPLIACVVLTVLDVVFIVVFYRPDGSMRGLRILYQSCGILGATVMPHSIQLGSGAVQSRLKEYDTKAGNLQEIPRSDTMMTDESYRKGFYFPSMAAIQHCMKFSIAEVVLSLFIFALFVNSAILIVAGAAMYQGTTSFAPDIFGMHDLLANSISSAAGVIFAFALLLSGVSAGLVCTISGQLVSEGALNWRMRPWLRRFVTRVISVVPTVVVVTLAGRSGLSNALTGTQVVLSTVLPVITAPLIYFTSRDKYMTVVPGAASYGYDTGVVPARRFSAVGVKMANSWWVTVLAVLIWLMITVMVVANLVLLVKSTVK
ncbi:metal ion transporter metal ion transporter [Colletotrichum somersetense]|nr:metal ion transporter metal ion transporter [Colletotrichum somersetense]